MRQANYRRPLAATFAALIAGFATTAAAQSFMQKVVISGQGSDGHSDYTLKATGKIKKATGKLNGTNVGAGGGDQVQGSRVDGTVWNKADGYRVFGHIRSLTLANPDAVTLSIRSATTSGTSSDQGGVAHINPDIANKVGKLGNHGIKLPGTGGGNSQGASGQPRQDCLDFDPQRTSVQRINGRWKITAGNQWLFDFGDDRAEAAASHRAIRHYGMNQVCYVGRPDPSLTYLLVDGHAPRGPFVDADCVRFDPDNVQVAHINGRWKIVDDNHWLFDFGGKRGEARRALGVIRHYDFKRSCFVGRPHPNFTYLRQ